MTFKELLPYVIPVLVLQLILMTVSLLDLARRERDRIRGLKWVWALVCIFVSTLGPIGYLVFGRKD